VTRPPTTDPVPPLADITFPWDAAESEDPVVALSAARAELGDTFLVDSGRDRYLFVFSADAVRDFYALPEPIASKGLADYRMLLRKLPKDLFANRRTFAHDLFGAQDVETYLDHLDTAISRQIDELGDSGTLDVFELSRRLGHRLALGCWMGDAAGDGPLLDALIREFDQLDGAEAFVHPERMVRAGRVDGEGGDGDDDRFVGERAALARVEEIVADLLADGAPDDGFLATIADRWADVGDGDRARGVTGDIVLLHVATMTNLFAALGWTLGLLVLHPEARARVEAGDTAFLERCELESIRLGQRSIMMRSVLESCSVSDGDETYALDPGVILATMLPVTNLTAAPGFDTYDPDRWDGRRLRNVAAIAGRELVTTFGHGSHRCPAQRFSLSAIGRAVSRMVSTFELEPSFVAIRPLPLQIGGVARPADLCLVSYRRR
jgi:cytochrome P450